VNPRPWHRWYGDARALPVLRAALSALRRGDDEWLWSLTVIEFVEVIEMLAGSVTAKEEALREEAAEVRLARLKGDAE
jgi:hypothetical protein